MCICIGPVFGQNRNKHLVQWSEELDSTFSWDLYKKKNISGGFGAVTRTNIVFEKVIVDDTIRISSVVYLDTKHSYYNRKTYKNRLPSTNLLNHEKLHFDIDEYYRRLLFQKISSIKRRRTKSINRKINRINRINSKRREQTQSEYDKETDLSKNKMEQREWEEKIHSMMLELSEFKHTEIILIRK